MDRITTPPLSKTFAISWKNIRVRFLRSSITTLSLVLAVAFLTYIQAGNDIADGMLASGDRDLCQALIQSGYTVSPGDTAIADNPKQRWIVFLSMLVCVVGILNAQLMSVTERFREIGTMKCIGALDRFVVLLFIFEAAIQGAIGAVSGAVFGALIALFTGWIRFGMGSILVLSWQALFYSMLLAIVTGVILSLAGVLYPAVVAARMQPVEAMRVEQ